MSNHRHLTPRVVSEATTLAQLRDDFVAYLHRMQENAERTACQASDRQQAQHSEAVAVVLALAALDWIGADIVHAEAPAHGRRH